jgi:hypothetical protein
VKQEHSPVEKHHRSFGAFLKYIEAAITDQRYSRYSDEPKVGRALDNIIKAIQKARPVLDYQRSYEMRRPPGGDAYYGDELHALQRKVYELEALRGLYRRDVQVAQILGYGRVPLPDGGTAKYEKPFNLPDEIQEELTNAVEGVFTAARGHPRLLPDNAPPVLPAPSVAGRHAAVRAALLENPDRPQAEFVKRCRVHPDTVRRTRRELEEAGEIPFLVHRHSKATQRKRAAAGLNAGLKASHHGPGQSRNCTQTATP